MDTFFQDLRFSIRTLLKRPGFTAVAVLTLTLGIGATTAIFSVVNGVLLRPLPFREPDRTLVLWESNLKDGIERDDVSPANFLDWRERNGSFENIAFVNPNSLDYLEGSEPETWQTAMVSEGFLRYPGRECDHRSYFHSRRASQQWYRCHRDHLRLVATQFRQRPECNRPEAQT